MSYTCVHNYCTQWTAEGSVFGAVSLWFLFVCEISPKPLNGFAPNSHGRCVWSLARTSLKVKVKTSWSAGKKLHFSALSTACVRFMFGKTSLASSFQDVKYDFTTNLTGTGDRSVCEMIDWVGFNAPLNTWQVISGTAFYGSNDPTDSVKALKEVVVLRIGFNPTRTTSLCYNPTHACNIQWYTLHKIIHTQKMNLSTVKWAQWDKTQSRELLGLFICVCIALCTTVAQNIAQNRP